MTKKVITFSDNSTHTVHYENSDDNTVVKFDVPDTENANKKQTITSHSKTDSFGRKIFDELQIGRGFVSRQFSYMPGAITEAHRENQKIKSTATTQLVSHIALSDGRTISYEYDDEERITKVTDSIDGTVLYTYDALGQLLTESITKDDETTIVNSMVYDNYGNIIKKNGMEYIYGKYYPDDDFAKEPTILPWKDLLTYCDGVRINYDNQGNPLTYLGHTLTWEKGRQLKSFDGNTYTYNANGIRTSKTINGVKHEYTLDGTKILRECWNYDETTKKYRDILIPLYDNEDSVCGILYNNVPYYFIKNLQGDVIAIVDKDAHTVARYSYDAWGVCTVILDSVGIANINPFRYRGYYYDEEIELYYLQSRYYDATIGTFINADESVFGTYLAERIVSHNLFAYADNGPVINIDGNGFYSLAAYAVSSTLYAQMAAMSAAATSLMVSIKAFVAMIWNIFVVVSLLLIAIAAIIYICKTIGNVYSTVQAKTNVSKDEYKKFRNNICVYVLARKERKIGSVFYVGRTKNIIARHSQHSNKKSRYYKGDFNMYVVYTCSSISQSKVVEQCVLAGCLTGKFTSIIFGAAPSNRINGISTKNAKKAISKLGKETADTISLLGCTTESDLLFMMNQ